jgi:hypothetical protein
VSGVTYDAGALIAAERGSRDLWLLHRRLLERGIRPTVPPVALAQAWRDGGRQAQLARLLRGCRVPPFVERDARAVGEALGASRTEDVVDAAVVVTACARDEAIVTSDPGNLRVVAEALGRAPVLHAI